MTLGTSQALMALSAASAVFLLATGANAQVRNFDVRATLAVEAIPEFARQAGVQIVAPATQLQDVRTLALKGRFETRAALTALLRGTNLETALDTGSTIVLRRVRPTIPVDVPPWTTPEPVLIDDVVVTAQKRLERQIDVPMAISVLSGRSLIDSQAYTLKDLQNRIPGLRVNGDAAGGEITIRNISIGAGINTSVGTYVDETPYGAVGAFSGGAQIGLSLDPYDIARIEVLRGPQGTNYGAIALAGILKYVTNAPDPSGFAASALVGASDVIGNTGYEAHGMVNVPINDGLALRIVGHDTLVPGYIDAPDRDAKGVNDYRRRGVRASLLWNVTDALKVQLGAEVQDTELADVTDFTLGARAVGYGDYIVTPSLFAQPSVGDAQIYSGVIRWELQGASLVSATSYAKAKRSLSSESMLIGPLVGSLLGGIYGAAIDIKIEPSALTQEFRVASNDESRLRWTVGAYYNNQDTPNYQFLNPFNVSTGLFEPAKGAAIYVFDVNSSYREFAGFANANYDLTEQLSVGAGGRYSDNKQSFHQISSGLIIGNSDFITKTSESVFTYSLDAKYKLSGRNNVYARIATGFVPGGPNNTIPTLSLPTSYESSTTHNYEVGIKGALGGRVFTYEVSAFRIDWENIQLSAIFDNIGVITNGPAARSSGVEAAMVIAPIGGLIINLSGAYADARLKADAPASNGGKAGDRLPNAPYFTSAVGLSYDWQVGNDLNATAGFDWAYAGTRLTGFSPRVERQILKSYSQVNARVGIGRGAYRATVYVKNIFGGDAISSAKLATFNGVPQFRATLREPRTIGFTLSAAY